MKSESRSRLMRINLHFLIYMQNTMCGGKLVLQPEHSTFMMVMARLGCENVMVCMVTTPFNYLISKNKIKILKKIGNYS